jgi:hypothetical protein
MTMLCATVPGIGVIVAASSVSVLDDAKRFRNAHAVSSYFGLVPGEDTTGGGKHRLGSVAKYGNTYARAMLVQAAWQIMRAGSENDPPRRWANQIATKRGKKIAAVALARKLAGMLWAMCRDETPYDAGFAARESTKGLKTNAQMHELLPPDRRAPARSWREGPWRGAVALGPPERRAVIASSRGISESSPSGGHASWPDAPERAGHTIPQLVLRQPMHPPRPTGRRQRSRPCPRTRRVGRNRKKEHSSP